MALSNTNLDYDAIVIGAGIAGLYQLYRLRELGMTVRVFERGTGVGGTWYWNRYPGARFDSESYSYAYSFSQELLDEWDWSEHFAPQPETLRYLQYVADKFDLLKDIRFSSEVKSAVYDDDTPSWEIQLDDGSIHRSRFLITAVGNLSEPTLPRIEGIESFGGQSFHTSRWPHTPVKFTGKRVAVIGTGATGVQTIQEVSKDVGRLTVFQLRPEWCAPLHNSKIDPDEMKAIRAGYREMFDVCAQTEAGFIHTADPRNTFEVTEEERHQLWERLYASRGFGIWQGNFKDISTDPRANKAISDFLADKIRARVNDPLVAEKLIPKDHGFGTRRVPLETNYYESYNQQNVELIDISETPILRITQDGILTTDREFELDFIIYATGFDAVVGSFNKIDIRGADQRRLKDRWKEELATFLGMLVNGFPNLFMITGPHAWTGNHPRSIEYGVEWITDVIRFMDERGLTRAEAGLEAQTDWHEIVVEHARDLLRSQVDSWFTGININLEGRQTRITTQYSGGQPLFRRRCEEVAANGYKELNLR